MTKREQSTKKRKQMAKATIKSQQKSGVYKITKSFLQSLGFNVNIDPRRLLNNLKIDINDNTVNLYRLDDTQKHIYALLSASDLFIENLSASYNDNINYKNNIKKQQICKFFVRCIY